MFKYLLLAIFFIAGCNTELPKVGTCYVDTWADNAERNKNLDVMYEVDKVIKVCPYCNSNEQIEYVYTFPYNMDFAFRWATIDSNDKGLVSESINDFTNHHTQVDCPW